MRTADCRLEDGHYRVVAHHSGKGLEVAGASSDAGARIIQWDWHGGDNQRFWIADAGGDLFSLRPVHSGKVLDVSGWSTENGAQIIQWDWHGGNNQLWQIVMPSARPAQRTGGAVRFDDEP